METKPYNLQSPEAIAKEYSGNKMKIAQAAQLGLLDPTAAVLAGMFIDRMRGAQQQEQAPQRTVAQQVLSPTPQATVGAGLGATPQAAQLAAAYPEQGAPPAIPGPTMPTQEPVMAADGGLMSLPVDDAMFEPAYKEGGIVAFAAGSQEPIQGSAPLTEQTSPAGRWYATTPFGRGTSELLARERAALAETAEKQALYNKITDQYRLRGGPFGFFAPQTDVEREEAKNVMQRIRQGDLSLPELRDIAGKIPTPITPTTAQPTLPAIAGRPDIRLPASPGERPPIPPLSGLGEIDVKAPSGLGSLAVGMPAAPKVSSVQKALEPVLKDYMGRSEERDKRLTESLGQDRLQGKVFEGYEKQLREQAEAAGAEKEDAKNMALFKAGLAIMSGTSSNAFENIGKGALTGVADYQEAFKNLKKAERERAKEFALIEQARRAEDQDDLKRRDMLLVRASTAAQARDEFGTKAMIDAGAKDQDRAFDLWKTQFAGGLQLQAANIAASARTAGATGIDPYKLAQLRLKVQESVDPLKIEKTVLNSLNMTQVPKPGGKLYADYQERLKKAYDAEVNQKLNFALGTAQEDTNPYPNFTRVPASN